MTNDEKKRLCDHLLGSVGLITAAMQRLEIKESMAIANAEVSDTIQRCPVCMRWTDVDVMEDGRCMRCDQQLNPANREKPE